MATGTCSFVRILLGVCVVLGLIGSAHATPATDWLQQQSQSSGAYRSDTPLATDLQSTSESVSALKARGLDDTSEVVLARDYLAAQAVTTTEELARRIRLDASAGTDTSTAVERLLEHQNRDGGFGDRTDYTSTALDTAWAVEGLALAKSDQGDAIGRATSFLLNRQKMDGSWLGNEAATEHYTTALVLRALARIQNRFDVSDSISAARAYLLSARDSSGAIGTSYESAAAILALAPTSESKTVYDDVVSSLQSRQASNGSWNDSVFVTALAIQALALAEQPQPNPRLGSMQMKIVDAETGAAIESASVTLSGVETRSGMSDGDGEVRFVNLPASTYSLEVIATDYGTVTGKIGLAEGEAKDLGTIRLLRDSDTDTASLRGTITSAQTGEPIQGATVTLSGTNTASAITDAEGRYRLDGLATGETSIEVRADGYAMVIGQLDLVGGAVSLLSVVLQASEGPAFTLLGTVTDRNTGAAIQGASVSIEGAATATVTTAADGSYQLDNLTPGDSTVTVSAAGFEPALASVSAEDGQRLVFSPALLPEGQTGEEPDTARVTGTVVDDTTGLALSGAALVLSVDGSTLTAVTNNTGEFAFEQVPEGVVELSVSAEGYRDLSLAFETTAGITFALGEIRIVPDDAVVAVNVEGTIIDSLSHEPVSGAHVELSVGSWKQVTLEHTYKNPVVVAGPLTHNNGRSLSVRVREVTGDSFEIGMQSPCARGGRIANGETCVPDAWETETVSYLVVEEGVWQSSDGTVIEAHRTTTNALTAGIGSGQSLRFDHAFGQRPAILHGVMTFNDPKWITSAAWGYSRRSNAPDTNGVTIALEGAEAVLNHEAETIGWIAIEPGAGTLGGLDYAAGVTGNGAVRGHGNGCFDIGSTGLATTAGALVAQTTRNGSDGGWVRYCDGDATDGRIKVHIDEDQVGDRERRHTNEYAAWLALAAFDAGRLTSPDGDSGTVEFGKVSLGRDLSPVTAVTDAGGEFGFGNVGTGQGALHVNADGYQTARRPVFVPEQDTDLGRIPIRPEGVVDGNPDLVAISTSGARTVTGDNGPQYDGTVDALWRNAGVVDTEASVLLKAYIDHDRNGAFDAADTELGSVTVAAGVSPGGRRSTAIEIAGPAPFRDTPITIAVDVDNDVIESVEDNNFASTATECRIEPPSAADLELALQWQTRGHFNGHDHAFATGPPAVGQFSDDNGDGIIDSEDIPDIVVATGRGRNSSRDTMLAIFSGDDGRLIHARHDFDVSHRASPAIGDVDGDGLNEIAVINWRGDQLHLVEHDGQVAWTTPTGISRHGNAAAHAPLITDLNGDGSPEIVVGRRAISADGSVLWTGSKDYGTPHFPSWGTVPIAADIHESSGMEVSAGRTLYGSDGAVIWHRADLPDDGTTGIGNFDSDEGAEIVLVTSGRVVLLEHTGETIWDVPLGSRGPGGPPTVADFDADGEAEIGIAGRGRYVVLETDGTIKWSAATDDSTSGATGSSLFDFDADGRAEVLYADERSLRIYEGATGRVLAKIQNSSVTKIEYPIVANVDSDRGAEIVLTSNPHSGEVDGLRVFEAAEGQWAPTRRIWNQHSYHVTNVNADGSIPVNEAASWLSHNSYRLNAFTDRDPLTVPDVTASLLKLVDNGAGVPATLRVRVGNAGGLETPDDIVVTFLDGIPATGGDIIGSAVLESMEPGEWRDIELDGVELSGLSGADLYARVDSEETLSECREDNNVAQAPSITPSLLGVVTVSTDGLTYSPDAPVSVSAVGENGGSFTGDFRIGLHVEDSEGAIVTDLGETDLGTLASGESGSAAAVWQTQGILSGTYDLVATLYGSDGRVADEARTTVVLQSTEGDLPAASLRTAPDAAVYGPNDTVAIEHLVRNVSPNAVLAGTQLTTVVVDPDGMERSRRSEMLGDLAAGAQRVRLSSYILGSAPEGTWTVRGVLTDAQGVVRATDDGRFDVVAGILDNLSGEVAVGHAQRYVGQPQMCSDTLTNEGEAVDIEIRRLVLDRERATQVHGSRRSLSLAAGETRTLDRTFATGTFDPGTHTCLLQVKIDGQWVNLDHSDFELDPPPIDIEGTLEAGDRGRLLVLLDPPVKQGQKAEDPHGPKNSPSPGEQRDWLEARLDESGWSYTIVTDGDRFAEELRSDGYAAVALLNEQVKIPERDQRYLTDAVEQDGIGLFVAGMHDRRNGRVEAALGLASKGKLLHADGLYLYDSEVATADAFAFAIDDKPLRLDLQGARSLGDYTTSGKGVGKGKSGEPGPALTVHTHGRGRSIDAGFDLLLQGTAAGGENRYSELLLASLDHVHPDELVPQAGRVWPLHLELVNEGLATPGRVVIEMPEGVAVVDTGTATEQDGTLIWEFTLDVDETIERDAWIRLPNQPGPVELQALIQTGTSPDRVDHRTVIYTIAVE